MRPKTVTSIRDEDLSLRFSEPVSLYTAFAAIDRARSEGLAGYRRVLAKQPKWWQFWKPRLPKWEYVLIRDA
jgi:hypothetical protein